MLTINYIESFFHIKEEYITGCYQTDEGLIYEVQLPVTTRTCPYCGSYFGPISADDRPWFKSPIYPNLRTSNGYTEGCNR